MKARVLFQGWVLALCWMAGAAQAANSLPDFTQLVEKEGKAVVNISTTGTVKESADNALGQEEDPFDLFRRFGFPVPPARSQPREYKTQSLGSGFIIESNGYVMTNAHVIANADEITVKLTDKRAFKAKVVGSDARTDVALLKIDATDLPKVDLGDVNKLKVGEWVVAIGSPFGLESSVTAGIVSAKERSLPDENFVPFIQTDTAVNPGNSGGPLFNLNGEVVGINSQIYSRSGGYMGLSFAIPIDVAMKVVGELKAHGKVARARLGVSIQEVNEDLAKSFGLSKPAGALVGGVDKSGPADKAGVKAGDILLMLDGQTIASTGDLLKLVGNLKPGTKVTLQIWRDKVSRNLDVILGELEAADSNSAKREYRNGKVQPNDAGRFGWQLQELDPRQQKTLGVKFGLLVRGVSGASAKAGLEAGDVIVGVAAHELTSVEQFRQLLSAVKAGDAVPLRIIRQGQSLFLTLKVPVEKAEK